MKKFLFLSMLFLFLNQSNAQTWGWSNPLPNSNSLLSIHFVDSNTGFITGYGGTILKTNDGGSTWQAQDAGSQDNIWDVSFLDQNNGFATGTDFGISLGFTLKTTNGGISWSKIGVNEPIGPVQFPSSLTGYGLGVQKYYKTINGGSEWAEIPVTLNGYNVQQFNSMYFLNENTGFLTVTTISNDDYILKSTDGGYSWNIVHDAGNAALAEITFINSTTGYCLQNNKVLKTSDAGDTWQTVYIGPASLYFIDLSFTDENNGYVSAGYSGRIFKTTDGGTTWIEKSIPSFPKSNALAFSSPDKGVVLCYEYPRRDLYITQDGGNSYQKLITGPRNNFRGIAFNTPNTGWAVGDSGKIAKTDNEGISWDTFPSFTTKNLTTIVFPGSSTGYTGGESGVIYKTNNSGSSWTLQNTGTTRKINSLCFLDVYNGYAAGDMGTILKTIDGGTTWISQNSGTIRVLYGISFCDQNNGLVVGADGGVYKTTNGGSTWNKIYNSPYSENIKCVQYIDPSTAFIAGEFVAYKTTDGGNSWSQCGTDFFSVNALHFINGSTGYFAGQGGHLFYTEDGGNTLTQVWTYCQADLYAFCVNPSNKGFLAGDYGTILMTTDFGVGTGKEPANEASLNIFPNPARDFININSKNPGYFDLEIIDINGKVVKKQHLSGGKSTLSISDLNPGIYVVRCLGDNDVIVEKFVKE